jgi:putative ABC transport system permease protein
MLPLAAQRPMKMVIGSLVLGGSLRLASIGTVLGIAASIVASRWVQSQLFGISALDPATLSIVAAGVLATTMLAVWQPLRDATSVNPVVALRHE